MSQSSTFDFSELPKKSCSDDEFFISDRLVPRLYDFVMDESTPHCTMALKGTLGAGKTTTLNFLREKILKETIQNPFCYCPCCYGRYPCCWKSNASSLTPRIVVVDLEPLLEAQFDLSKIMQDFLLKMHLILKKQNVNKKLLGSVSDLISAISISAGHPPFSVGLNGKSLVKAIKNITKIWQTSDTTSIKSICKNLNDQLLKFKIRILVLIEDIDRLPAKAINNFLLFTRMFEEITSLKIIVAIDYLRTIDKLAIKKNTQLDRTTAMNDINKFFQSQIEISTYIDEDLLTKFAFKVLHHALLKIGIENIEVILKNIQQDYEKLKKFENIVKFLLTPRNIVNWGLTIQQNHVYFKHSNDPLCWAGFIAVYSKYPTVLSNMFKFKFYLSQETYGSNRQLVFLGLTKTILILGAPSAESKTLEDLGQQHSIQLILDNDAASFTVDFFKTIPEWLIEMFLLNISTDVEISRLSDFLKTKDISFVLDDLVKNDNRVNALFTREIVKILQNPKIEIKAKLNIEQLNNLWTLRVGNDFFIIRVLIKYLLSQLDIFTIIRESLPAISEFYLLDILDAFNIKNNNGKYDLTSFNNKDSALKYKHARVLSTPYGTNQTLDTINDVIQLKEFIKAWVHNVSQLLEMKSEKIFSDPNVISILYRFLQLANTLVNESAVSSKVNLINYTKNYLSDPSTNKVSFTEMIFDACRTHTNPIAGVRNDINNPLLYLFDKNSTILNKLESIGLQESLNKYLNDFLQCKNIETTLETT